MPWEDVVKSLNRSMSDADLESIPRDEECLKYMFRLHLKVAGKDFHQHLKQVHLRPQVLVMLLHELIDRQHHAFKGYGPADDLKDRTRKLKEGTNKVDQIR